LKLIVRFKAAIVTALLATYLRHYSCRSANFWIRPN